MTGRTLLGELPDGSFGLKVSRPGYEVTDDSVDHKNVAFDSRLQSMAKLVAYGTLSWGGSAMTVMFGRTLAKPPIVLAQGYPSFIFGSAQNYWSNITSFPLTDSYWGDSSYNDITVEADRFIWHGTSSATKLLYAVLGV